MNHSLLAAALLAALCAPAWAANKCAASNGKVVYQDMPCEGGEKVNLSGAGQADANSSGAIYWKREAARQTREMRAKDAIADGKVFIGMTADEVIESWGDPTAVNRTITAGDTSEQWVYRRGSFQAQYIYLRAGIVTSLQSPN